ncbi:MAG: alpha/beta fold hydrolase [Parvularcula sp.]
MLSHPFLIIGIGFLAATVVWARWNAVRVSRHLPPAGELIDSPFGKLHVVRYGKASEKRPIVLIHGSTTNLLDMELEIAPRLAAEREVLVIDRLGHGYSDRPEDGWRLDVQARAIHFAIEEAGFEEPIILGQSFGGAVALRYALEFPEDYSGLVLIAPVSHAWPGGVAWYNRVALNPRYGWLFRHTFIALYGRFGSLRGARQALHGSRHQENYHERTRVALTFRPNSFRHNAEDIVRLYEQLFAMDKRYHEIEKPTEIVAGTHDMTVITTVHGRSLEREISGASLEVIDGGGHALHHTNPDETIAAVHRLDERLASLDRSLLQGALQRLSQVLPGTRHGAKEAAKLAPRET